ncbi:MAG: amidohydrolase [Chloroflexi bacterium]|nr:amidohydrolase [Chloroflexota bacterium]
MLIDVHAHIFPAVAGQVGAGPTRGLGYGRIRVGDRVEQLMPPCGARTVFSAETLMASMDWAGVDRAVLLQGTFYGPCNDYALAAVERYPERLRAAAWLDPWLPDAHAALDAIVAAQGYCAVKLECSEPTGLLGLHPGARLDDPALDWLWAALAAQRLVLVLDLGAVGSASYQTDAVRAIALRHSALRLVIAHLGQPTPRAEAEPALWRQWCAQIDLGRLPNVWFDSAALPAYTAEEGYPFPSAARYLELALAGIGAKILWGSDLPGMLVHATYAQLARLAELHTRRLAPADRVRILSGNALAVYWGQ